jgi:hypothetical protein
MEVNIKEDVETIKRRSASGKEFGLSTRLRSVNFIKELAYI